MPGATITAARPAGRATCPPPPRLVRQSEFARLIGRSRQRVGQWAARGLPMTEAGLVPIDAGLAWVTVHVEGFEPAADCPRPSPRALAVMRSDRVMFGPNAPMTPTRRKALRAAGLMPFEG